MASPEQSHLERVRAYLQALEAAASGEALARFFTPDVIQEELPNLLNPRGGRSDLATLLSRAERVKDLLASQRYTIVSELAVGSNVAVEATWSAVLATGFGAVPAGTAMKAHFAMFFELADGRIRRQRNYDCFEPW
jgi:ketosteroid isomerase-like protein